MADNPSISEKSEAAEIQRICSRLDKFVEERYSTTAKLVQILQEAPGLEGFSRTTLFRWKRAANAAKNGQRVTGVDFSRARRAVEYLELNRNRMPLKLSISQTLQLLPAMLLLWDPEQASFERKGIKVKENSPYGLLRKRGVDAQAHWCAGGKEALELLRDQPELAIGFAAEDFYRREEKSFWRLCRVTKAKWSGLSKAKLTSSDALGGRRIGYSPVTAMQYRIQDLKQRRGLKFQAEMPSVDPQDHLRQLQHDKANNVVIVGWDPLLSQLKHGFKGRLYDVEILERELADFSVNVDLFVRTTASPSVVRVFLDALEESTNYVNDPRNAHEIADVCVRMLADWHLERPRVKKMLEPKSRTCEYEIGDLNQQAARRLWAREIAEAKLRTL